MNSNSVLFLLTTIICFSFNTIGAESGFFWHVTDFHYDPSYWGKQLSCNNNVSQPGLFGDYWCDSNWRLVNDSVTNMARIKTDVDFVIWTGDSVAHIKDQDTSLDENIEILQNITDILISNFPAGTKFLPSLGNHDFYPSDQADVKQDEMYNKTAEVWKNWIPDAEELARFMNGGFFSMTIGSKLRLLSVNTNLYYNHNKITKGMEDPAGQFVWMKNVLEQARQDGEKVIVTAHVTPGVLTPRFASWMYSNHLTSYVGILTNYSDIILASHYGHDHSDGFKIIQDVNDNSKAIPQYIAPSVTPWRFRAGSLVGNPHNPGIRLVEYDRQTGQHINYVQYYINLTDTNNNNQSNWSKLYDFRETYQVDDMSVDSLRKIFDKVGKSDDGPKLAQKYCNYALVSKFDKTCSKTNRFEIVCGGLYYELDKAKKCVDEYLIGTAPLLSVHVCCIVLPLLFALYALLRT